MEGILLRLPTHLLKKIDRRVEKRRDKGETITRSSFIRELIIRGLRSEKDTLYSLR